MADQPVQHAESVRTYVKRIVGRRAVYECFRCRAQTEDLAAMKTHSEIHRPVPAAEEVFVLDLVQIIEKMDQVERRVLLGIAEGMVKAKEFYEAKAALIDGADNER